MAETPAEWGEVRPCGLFIPPHHCVLNNCPRDDPFHVHICYADDFDWTDGEMVQWRSGRITDEEFVNQAQRRAALRINRFTGGKDEREGT